MRRAALLIHGFMGKSEQLDYIGDALTRAGYEAHALTLPGHGGSLADFTRADRHDWQASVDGALAALRARYDAVYVVGHSMGGLLAIRAAVENPDKIERIAALALPLFFRLSLRGLHISFRSLLPPRPNEAPEIRAARDTCGVEGLSPLSTLRLVPNTLGLIAVMRETRGLLGRLDVPLCILHSSRDELVSARTLRFAHDRLPDADILLLPESSHSYYPDSDQARIIARLLATD